jgi:hypothetical protein
MFQEHYRAYYDGVTPDRALIIETLGRINDQRRRLPRMKKPLWRRPAIVAAALLICICTAAPVMAANVPAFYELLYMASPQTAQFFKPVLRACEDNGVRMEVVATYIHGDTAEIYITLQDLTGSRVDATTDLYDSYSIHRPFGSVAHCERVGYDEVTKTATFLIEITEWGNQNIEGDKLTFSVGCFISDKHKYEDVPVNIDLGTLDGAPETREITHFGGSGPKFKEYFVRDNKPSVPARVLVPAADVFPVVDGITVSGIGFVDGKLHIQTSETDALKHDNHGFFYLEDKKGNEINYEYYVGYIEYGEPGNEKTRVDYNEFVFDIPQSDISEYSLFGSFYTSGLYTEGNWSVTFPIEENWTADERLPIPAVTVLSTVWHLDRPALTSGAGVV